MNFKFKRKYNPPVFYTSVIIIALIIAITTIFPKFTLEKLKLAQEYLTVNFGWFYVLSMTIIFFVVVFLGISRFGKIKLGPDHSKPDYANGSWFAMLFAAGMGIGLMFFGVGEPLMHYLAPPSGDPRTIEAAKKAMNITFFHWGLNAWAVYGIVAIILAFFAYRHNLPLTLRSAFYPIIGNKIYGKFGDAIDVFAVIATLFGVTTSLGYGVLQVNSGFNYLFGMPISNVSQVLLIFAITIGVTLSATSGVDKGIKLLSNTNMVLAVLFAIFILILGETSTLLKSLIENTGTYISSFIGDTFNLYAYEKQNDSWIGGWTILYWTWWISWSPFVGLFIARISRGRTIREFVIGVLFVPAGFTLIWMTVFGNSAINLVNGGFEQLAIMVNKDISLALFIFLEQFPLTLILAFIAVFMIILFFITSADSAAMVIDMLCSKGEDKTPKWQKVFWCALTGILAAALLYTGGLDALQTMTIVSALPLTLAMLGSIYGLLKALRIDSEKKYTQSVANLPTTIGSTKSWQERLQAIIDTPDKNEAKDFLIDIIQPAFSEISEIFNKNSLNPKIHKDVNKSKIALEIDLGDEQNFIYGVKLIETNSPDYAMSDSYYRAEVFLKEGGQDYDIIGWSKASVINDIIEQYRRHMHFLHKTR
ncbi:BCCT family transporter [Campylobacter sp. RM12327]|uniref:BCCT family transporter n=1 Tax=Campylobacter sputorum TaxID=206 RepID=UPI000B78825C|nr:MULTISPECIES: BCCT family transporter [Campylobacter]ASM40726.1 BCCT (betaine/carnitine/choline) family transporter [Campylobacter sputorum]MBE7357974.1 BCCT family transporter [Campylobacter sp. RM11302]MBF6669624.1 BCCT family transporter [Campylobacter sp. RM12327]MBF6674904.1 BCCT family transporter [Campylobacter sp. RM13538]MBF6676537.1 BCCT family transporter [Campylobacter sp. RM12321]